VTLGLKYNCPTFLFKENLYNSTPRPLSPLERREVRCQGVTTRRTRESTGKAIHYFPLVGQRVLCAVSLPSQCISFLPSTTNDVITGPKELGQTRFHPRGRVRGRGKENKGQRYFYIIFFFLNCCRVFVDYQMAPLDPRINNYSLRLETVEFIFYVAF
jgi:hypothetical protein